MIELVPPPTPPADVVTFDDSIRRIHFRLWQIVMTALTIGLTVWFMTFGVVSAVLALMVGKHVLVAIFAVGLELPPPRRRQPGG